MFISFCCESITEIIKSIKVMDDELNLEIIDYCNKMMVIIIKLNKNIIKIKKEQLWLEEIEKKRAIM